MTLSDLSIRRPVLASVMSLLIMVAGGVAYFQLPVREYPDVDLPLVSVTTIYPGASPEVVEATITEPLEQTLNGVDQIRSVRSSSSFGRSSITVEFHSGRDLDLATNDVTNALQTALGELPLEAERPVVAKAGANARPIIWLRLAGEDYPPEDLQDIAERIVKTPLQTLPGVANIFIGGRRYAMRIWLDPERMAARRVDARDVRQAVLESNLQLSAGQIEGAARKFTVLGDASLDDPSIYEELVLRDDGNRRVRVRDVATVELGSSSYQTATRFDGEDIVGVGIVRQSRSNELEVSRAVRAALPGIRDVLPHGVTLDVAVDNTIFVEESLGQVAWTLLLVLALVVVVNLFFLHSPRATAITSVAIPVALVGTFGVMEVLGFSLNVLSLLALLLVIGLLVDDAIVVLENVYRRQEGGESPLLAARNGTRQVGFAVIATTTATVAVLVPLSLMTGNTGRLFREFALTMAAAVIFSTFVALSLVPALCSRYLRVAERESRLARAIEATLEAAASLYERTLRGALHRGVLVGLLIAGIVAGMLALGWRIPQVFVPTEDRGSIVTILRAPEGATLAFTDKAMRIVEDRFRGVPEVEGFFGAIGLAIGGPPSTSSAIVFARLRPWSERERKQQEIVASLFPDFNAIPYALVFPINTPSLGQGSQSEVQVVVKSPTAGLDELGGVVNAALARVRQVPGLVNVDSDLRLEDPQLDVSFDRELAADIGVPVSTVADSLRLLVAQGPADEFIMRAKQYDVVTALAAPFRAEPEHLGVIHVRATDGTMVPLSTVVRLDPRIGPSSLNHFDLQRSATISGSLQPGAALGRVLDEVLSIVKDELGPGFTTALDGPSREFVEAGRQVLVTFGVALLVIYLVLAAQFESFVHPLTVMFSVPLAGLGAFLALWLAGGTFNIYSEVGLILLVGLVTKNSILLVDFANQRRARGDELLPALREAGRIRFRPILMTSATSILGAVPLAFATGAGEETRRAIGIVIVGGLLFSTAFTLVVIPVVHQGVVRAAEGLGIGTIPPKTGLDESEEDGPVSQAAEEAE